ncbi:MAG: outer membrane beta-barrel protein [Bacteroidota bacterium]
MISKFRFFLFLSFSIGLLLPEAYSQGPGGRPPGGRPGANGTIYGKIIDSKSGKPIELASVQLLNRTDSTNKSQKAAVAGGMITRSNGEFRIENISLNRNYELTVTVIGFNAYRQPLELKATGFDATMERDLGNIRIEIQEKQLENVTVTSTGSGLKLGIDRKIFSVDKNLVATGGTAIDVVRNIPSLTVDLDGNLTMRNNTPQIFVDGRPTNLTLDQLPADAIEAIELITNPSAKYDASGGTAGILNVILKKNKRIGYNGSIRTNIDSRARIGGGADLNLRQNKVNFFLNANYNQRKSISTGNTSRTTSIGNPITKLNQYDTSISLGRHGFLRSGLDWFINNRNTLSVTMNLGQGRFRPTTESSIWIDSLNMAGPPNSSKSYREARNTGSFDNQGFIVGFKHLFPKAGQEWTADITYNGMTSKNTNDIRTDVFPNPSLPSYNRSQQQQLGNGINNSLIVQSDYVRPISDKQKWEMGIRAQFRQVDNQNNFYLIPSTGSALFLPDLSVNYKSDDRVYAAYSTYTSVLGKWNYQLGLRLESSDYRGELPDKGQTFEIPFPISLFPSVFLSRKAEKEQELQLNYTRKINRPNFWQLYPFTDYSDSLNISRGNPNLRPEFTNSFEVSYQKTFKNKDNFIASAYFKRTEGLITRYQQRETLPTNGKDVLINTYVNAQFSYLAGMELISKNKIARTWELTTNLNLFQSGIELSDPTLAVADPMVSWQLKMNHTFKIWKRMTLQLNTEYLSKTVLPPSGSGRSGGGGWGGGGGGMWGQTASTAQGYSLPNYFMDAGYRIDLGKTRQSSLSVNWSDVFRTRRQQTETSATYFNQTVFRRRDPQLVRLNFNWRFGKVDASLFKRKNNKGGSEGMEGMSM